MAVVRTGPASARDESGKPVGPRVQDIGAAHAAGDGLAALGRLSATKATAYLQADTAHAAGAGPIERRHETPDERAAREAREAAAAKPAIRIPEGPAMHLLRQPARPATPPRQEQIDVPEPIPTAPPEIPCGPCLHEPVCALKAHLADIPTASPVRVLERGLRVVAIGIRVECDHFLAAPPAAAPAPFRVREASVAELERPRVIDAAAAIAASRQRGASQRQKATDEEIIVALREHEGNASRAAGALGMTQQSVKSRVERLRRRGTLPADVIAFIAGRSRKAVPA